MSGACLRFMLFSSALVDIFSVLVSVSRTVGNYMLWRIVMNRVNNMPQKYLDVRRQFSKVRQLYAFTFLTYFYLITSLGQNLHLKFAGIRHSEERFLLPLLGIPG